MSSLAAVEKKSGLMCAVYVLVRICKDPIEVFSDPLLERLIINECSITNNVFTDDIVPFLELQEPPASWLEVLVTKSKSQIPDLHQHNRSVNVRCSLHVQP